MPAVELQNVSKEYHSVLAVRGIDLAIREGEFLALLGPSGCGKTTTLRMVAGFEVPTAGEIRIRGRTVSGPGHFVPPEERNVGMVFQSHAVWPHMTVEANVDYPLKLRGLPAAERRERTRRVLELVQLPGLEARFPTSSRGGSSNGWRWLGRSTCSRRSCSSTNPCPTWTRSCGRKCGWRSLQEAEWFPNNLFQETTMSQIDWSYHRPG